MKAFDDPSRVLERAEQAANNVRTALRISGPFSALEIARMLDMQVVLDKAQRPRGITCPGEPMIWLKDGQRTTRTEHACAHELGHHHVYDQGHAAMIEDACNRFAAALMLPADEFSRSARDHDCDPLVLAKIWRFSSPEIIARRLGEVMPGVLSAKWVDFSVGWHAPSRPRAGLARLELEALGDAYLRPRGHGTAEGRSGRARVWRMSTGPKRALAVMQSA